MSEGATIVLLIAAVAVVLLLTAGMVALLKLAVHVRRLAATSADLAAAQSKRTPSQPPRRATSTYGEPTLSELVLAGMRPSIFPANGGRFIVLPISSKKHVKPGDPQVVSCENESMVSFFPTRLVVANADYWHVYDISVGGKSQFSDKAGLPGGHFAEDVVDAWSAVDELKPGLSVSLRVGYGGGEPEGRVFVAAIMGYEDEIWSRAIVAARKTTKPMFRKAT